MSQIDVYNLPPGGPLSTEYMFAVMEAHKNGLPIQFRRRYQRTNDWYEFEAGAAFAFNWQNYVYRVAPHAKPKTKVPLTEADIPPVCWVRQMSDNGVKCMGDFLVNVVSVTGIGCYSGSYCYDRLMQSNWQYSSDRKDWKPCYKEV